MNRTVVFRADGDAQIGFGHLFRLLAFRNLIKEQFQTLFLTRSSSAQKILNGIESQLILEEDELTFMTNQFDPKEVILVLDGYQFDRNYQYLLKKNGYCLVYVDDLNAFEQVADVVINHAAGITDKDYQCSSNTRLCLGLDYMLIRSSFLKASEMKRSAEKLQTVFVCFGGADPEKLSERVVNVLMTVDYIEKIHVVGKKPSSIDDSKRIYWHQGLGENEILALMQESDLAFAPSSTISYELCCAQVPLISGYFVDNQRLIYKGLKEMGTIVPIEDYTKLTEEKIALLVEEFRPQEKRQELMDAQQVVFNRPVKENLINFLKELC